MLRGEETLALLREHLDRQRFLKLAAGERWRDHDLIVVSNVGTPVNPAGVQRSFNALVKVADVPNITVHGLRHTCASLLLLAGVHLTEVSERLGHFSITVTLDTYSHLLPDMQDAAAQAMSRILTGTSD